MYKCGHDISFFFTSAKLNTITTHPLLPQRSVATPELAAFGLLCTSKNLLKGNIFSTEEEGQAKLMDKKMYGFNILKWRGISLGKLCYILLILNQYMKWLVRVMP